MPRLLCLITLLFPGAAPAAAAPFGGSLPEPSGMALLAIGLAGVVIGRRLSRRPPSR